MRIQHNIAALNSYRNLGANNTGVSKNLEKLSSGYRINRAGDDAAGLAISEKMRSQITGLNTATKNANDGISLVQTAEGALTEVHSMLNRMVEIATQSSNGVYEDGVDRAALQDEMDALTDEINRIADGTNFNKKNLLNGKLQNVQQATIVGDKGGADNKAAVNLTFSFGSGDGIKITLQHSAATDNAKAADGVSVDTTGKNITLKLNANATYNGEEIETFVKNHLKEMTDTVTDEKDKLAFGDAIRNLKIEGSITGATAAANNTVFATDVTGDYTKKENAMRLQIGDTNADFNHIKVDIDDMHADNLGIGKTQIDVKTEDAAGESIDAINHAINLVSTQRGQLGAIQNRLEHTINNLNVNAENMTAAESRIRDVDMAKEMMDYTKNNILVQASQAMLAQANQVPQGVLQLLQ